MKLSLNILLLFCFTIILSVSYYEDTADVYAANPAPLIDSQGNVRSWGGGRVPLWMLLALIAGLIVIPLIIKRKFD
jgi:hypothetical protein